MTLGRLSCGLMSQGFGSGSKNGVSRVSLHGTKLKTEFPRRWRWDMSFFLRYCHENVCFLLYRTVAAWFRVDNEETGIGFQPWLTWCEQAWYAWVEIYPECRTRTRSPGSTLCSDLNAHPFYLTWIPGRLIILRAFSVAYMLGTLKYVLLVQVLAWASHLPAFRP